MIRRFAAQCNLQSNDSPLHGSIQSGIQRFAASQLNAICNPMIRRFAAQCNLQSKDLPLRGSVQLQSNDSPLRGSIGVAMGGRSTPPQLKIC
jgi:hypothetical protein